jgi:class 3 adenylate cyclase
MEQKDYRLAAIMYTDIVGFSRMMEKDEAGTLELLHYHNKLVSEAAVKRRGTVIKTIGDAFLVDFRNTVDALQCAMDIQAELYERNKAGGSAPLLLRIGVHLGDIYFFENDALGEGINIASRLQSLARPGCICFSQDVYNQVLNKIDFRADKLGKVSLKNISKEIHAYEIASPNVEFDPERDKPRQGFIKEPLAGDTIPAPKPKAAPSLEEAKAEMDVIRAAILDDIKKAGRRLSVREALDKYGDRGVEAQEVIAALADRGLLLKTGAGAGVEAEAGRGADRSQPSSSDLAGDIGKAVEGIARAIQEQVVNWQEAGKGAPGGRTASTYDRGRDGTRHELREAAREIKREIRAAVRPVMDEKRALKEELRRHSEELGTGKWDAELKDSDYFKPGAEDLESDFNRYRDRVEEKSRKTVAGFMGNLLSFVGVNALLWYINTRFAPGFMWAAIVTAGWGTGVVSNFFAMLRGRAKIAELERMPALGGESLDAYKKLNRVRDSMAMHTASVLSVPVLLFTINLLTSPGFLWAAIPSGIMALSFLGHLASYPVTKNGLVKKILRLEGASSWRELLAGGKERRNAAKAAGPYAALYADAVAARDDIARAIKADKAYAAEFGKDILPSLDRYVGQVKLLTQSINEIDELVAGIPLADLAKDKAEMQKKMGASDSSSLKAEYKRSIEEIERQEKASKDLEDQREVLKLRLSSSVNSLKQLKLDMARMKALPQSSEHEAIEEIRRKASAMAGYLDDLKAGYEESVKDPFEELERLAAEADSRKRLEGPDRS